MPGVRGLAAAPERVSVVFERPNVERLEGARASVFKAARLEVHGRMAAGSVSDNPVLELAVRMAEASAALGLA